MQFKKMTLMVLMIVASVAAIILRPTHKLATERQGFVLEQIIPARFDDWQMDVESNRTIVNPQQATLINKLYSQTLSRTYVNGKGERVMLVIAYGEDQSDSTGLHYPEVCYPAQGFQITHHSLGRVSTEFGDIRVKRLVASMGNRIEPITYWTTIGNQVVVGNKETKLKKLEYGINGVIPDGILFRVSSFGSDFNSEYLVHQEFVNDLMITLNKSELMAFAGL